MLLAVTLSLLLLLRHIIVSQKNFACLLWDFSAFLHVYTFFYNLGLMLKCDSEHHRGKRFKRQTNGKNKEEWRKSVFSPFLIENITWKKELCLLRDKLLWSFPLSGSEVMKETLWHSIWIVKHKLSVILAF